MMQVEPEIARPRDAREALALHAGSAGAAWVAGATAMQLDWRAGMPVAMRLVDVTGIVQARGVQVPGHRPEAAGAGDPTVVRLGAATRLEALRVDPLVRARLPLLAAILAQIGSLAVRNVATLGGNLGWRRGDTLALLLAADASIETAGGERLPLARWLDMACPALALAVHTPSEPVSGDVWCEKIAMREAFAPSLLTLARWHGRLAAVAADLPARRLHATEAMLAVDAAPQPQALRAALGEDLVAGTTSTATDRLRVEIAARLVRGHAARSNPG